MKKTIFILIVALFLSAFGYQEFQLSQPVHETPKNVDEVNVLGADFMKIVRRPMEANTNIKIKIDTRFVHQVSKSTLQNASSVYDILPDYALEDVTNMKNVKLGIIKEYDKEFKGEDDQLTIQQRHQLSKLNYSDNYYIKSIATKNYPSLNDEVDYELTYYMSVVPEQSAFYADSNEVLVKKLKESIVNIAQYIDTDALLPGRIKFTITENGELRNVIMDESSGNNELDKLIQDGLLETQNQWNAAQNYDKMNVAQELILFYGKMGC